uniref:Death domain-containing protein n=1 Tax=Amphimedon queenslandica TaxID=400682 RepID=A0A1X7VN93_AMPQE
MMATNIDTTPPGRDQQKTGAASIPSFGSKLDLLVENIKKCKEKVFQALNDENIKEIKRSLHDLLTASKNTQEEASLIVDFLSFPTRKLEENQLMPAEEETTMTLPAAVTEVSGLVKILEEIVQLLQGVLDENLQYILKNSKLQKGSIKSSTLQHLRDYSSAVKNMTSCSDFLVIAATDKKDISSCAPMLDAKEAGSAIKLSSMIAQQKSPSKTREDSSSHAAAIDDIWQESPSHRELMDLLSCISHEWSMLGICLELDQNALSSLQQRQSSSKEKLSKVLHKWKIQQNKSAPYTWQTIKNAVCGPILQNRRVGREIEEYLAKKNASATPHNNNEVIAVDEQVQTSLEQIPG